MNFIFFWVSCMALSALLASAKRETVWVWVVISFFIGPLGLLILLFVPAKPQAPEKKSSEMNSPLDLKAELTVLKVQADNLYIKLGELEKMIDARVPAGPVPEPAPREFSLPAPVPGPETAVPPLAPDSKSDVELKLGKYWLNRIGIVVFTLGVGFLITYTFRSLGAWAKICFGYAVSFFLFYLGGKWERQEKLKQFGRVLLGGAWALVYFTTYAMYHFDASRVLNSQGIDLALLALVSAGMIAHSLKYRSQELSGAALFIGYITATMGDVNYFTLSGCALLALTALVLMYKLHWIKFIFIGIILTYASHLLWVLKHIYFSRVDTGYFGVREVYFSINTGFLFLYWLLFTAGIHCMAGKDDSEKNNLASGNFLNCILFFFMAYPKIAFLYPEYKFFFVCVLGLLYLSLSFLEDWKKNKKLYNSNTIIAVFLLTLAVPLKLFTYHTTVIWLIELPFLLLTGLLFDRRVFRYLSIGLSALIFLKFLTYDYSSPGAALIFGYRAGWNVLLSCAGFTSMCWCYFFYRSVKTVAALDEIELNLRHIFSIFAAVYCASWLVLSAVPEWVTFLLSLEIILLMAAGFLLRDACLRFCAFVLSMVVSSRFIFVDKFDCFSPVTQWFLIGWIVTTLYAAYFTFRRLDISSGLRSSERMMKNILFSAATCLFVYAVHEYTRSTWVSLALGAAGLCLFTVGFLSTDKFFRIGGFVVFAVTVARVFFVDLSGLPIIYKFVSFILLGIVFLGVSFVYNKFSIKSENDTNTKK
jgi:uncharacterized membrane protein